MLKIALDPILAALFHSPWGIAVLGIRNMTSLAFSDNTVVATGSAADAITRVQVLSLYAAASNAKVNTGKTIKVPVGSPTFQISMGASPCSTTFIHLGILISTEGVDLQANKDKVLAKLNAHVTGWNGKNITPVGRAMMANTFLLSVVWFLT